MASKESDARFRIAVALIATALAVAALFLTWRPEIELWFRISASLMCAILLLWSALILVGTTKSGRQILTRRHWKYFTILGVVVAAAITVAEISTLAVRPVRYSPLTPPLYAMLLGLFVAYPYEPGGPPIFKAGELSDRDARAWKRTAVALAVTGIIFGCIAGIAAAVGNIFTLALVLPFVIVPLLTAAIMGTVLRARNRRRTNP